MGCDWDAAVAVDTFFQDPEGYEVHDLNDWSQIEGALAAQMAFSHDLCPYRNPVARKLGIICHCNEVVWAVPFNKLPDEYAHFVDDFRAFATTINTLIQELKDA